MPSVERFPQYIMYHIVTTLPRTAVAVVCGDGVMAYSLTTLQSRCELENVCLAI